MTDSCTTTVTAGHRRTGTAPSTRATWMSTASTGASNSGAGSTWAGRSTLDRARGTSRMAPSREDLLKAGVPEEAIVERSDHPGVLASTWDVSASDLKVSARQREYRFPHLKPQSVLVTPIGNLWDDGAW